MLLRPSEAGLRECQGCSRGPAPESNPPLHGAQPVGAHRPTDRPTDRGRAPLLTWAAPSGQQVDKQEKRQVEEDEEPQVQPVGLSRQGS